MLKIGDFSKLSNVTVKALRHYAELGLLKPAWIDRYSGYRYYTLEQLPRLNRILALKDLGLSLEQVQRVLDSHLSVDEMRGMLHHKQAELQQKLIEEQMRLARVEARLKQIEQEGRPTLDAVVVRPVDSMLVAYINAVAATPASLTEKRAAARRILQSWLADRGVADYGPWLEISTSAEYVERDIKVEVCVVLNELPRGNAPSPHQVMVRRMPALPHAAIYHHTGPQQTLPQAYAALYGWVEANGYRVTGMAREIYWSDAPAPPDSPDSLLDWEAPKPAPTTAIEVQLPVEPILLPKTDAGAALQPEIIDSRPFLVAGTLYEGKNEHQEIPAMWANQFIPRMQQIKSVDPYITYGVCEMDDRLPAGALRYTAAAAIARPEDAPPDFYHLQVPGGKYAAFKHVGSLAALRKTYEYIYQSWLPQSGYRRDNRPDIEVYDQDFHDFQPDSVLYLWVPIW